MVYSASLLNVVVIALSVSVFTIVPQIVVAVLGLYAGIVAAAVARSKIKAANAPVPTPIYPDFHTGNHSRIRSRDGFIVLTVMSCL